MLIIIVKDERYENKEEEETQFISRWVAKNIIHPQVCREFVDGRKSFVFSWNEEHRPIHEEAMLHFLDSNNGQAFNPNPKPKIENVPVSCQEFCDTV